MNRIKKYLKDFAQNLGPRYREINGMKTDFSGEEYREDYLIPMLKDKNNKYILDIDNTQGSSSFWEEAFGGAVRAGYSPAFINDHIEIISTDKELLKDIQKYMEREYHG